MSVTDERPPVVLVAEDDADILELIAHRLATAGYDVVTVPDGEQALRVARERRPDLAVLDVTMPKLTGCEVTRALRADNRTSRMPVILLTARVQESDVAAGLDAGADDYLRKPFSAAELRDRVAELLARS
ncbi:MAG: response regulator [Actinomycetota bacterium]|nr:response regulator [Actinomycetota bacterium]